MGQGAEAAAPLGSGIATLLWFAALVVLPGAAAGLRMVGRLTRLRSFLHEDHSAAPFEIAWRSAEAIERKQSELEVKKDRAERLPPPA